MGLDGVELIMAVEEEFGVAIPDSEAEQCVTVEKLVDVVLPKLRQSNTDPCGSQHGFYTIRKILVDKLELKRSQVKLGTKLDDIIEQSQRDEIWCSLMGVGPSVATPLVRPHNVSEVRDLIRFVAPLDSRIWTKDDVFLKIREITAEQLGVEESEVTLETDYVRDLGC